MKRILAFSGSSSSRSINQMLARYTMNLLPDFDARLIDLRDYMAPIYSIDIEKGIGIPQNIKKLKGVIDDHDGLIISLPEHNGTLTALFKNTVDWLSRIDRKFLNDKHILLLSASPGKRGAVSALEHGQRVLRSLGGDILATYSVSRFHKRTEQKLGQLHITDQGLADNLSHTAQAFREKISTKMQLTAS